MPQIACAGSARLLRYGEESGRAPVVFVPSLINPPAVLDLSEGRSLLRRMAAAGHDAYLVDWGAPTAADAALDLADHVTRRLLPLLSSLPRPPVLVGYCLGGSLVLAAAALMPLRAVATIAAPWHFGALPAEDRERIAALWRNAKPMCERLGYVPMEVLQAGFWALDPQRTIRKYAAFAEMAPGSEEERAFMAVEDWANGGPPLTFSAGADLFERFYGQDLPGKGQWAVGGQRIDPAALPCPGLSIRSATDRIVPADAAPILAENRTLELGHVGMIVGSQADALLARPLSAWLSSQGG